MQSKVPAGKSNYSKN